MLGTTPLGPVKDAEFSELWLPSRNFAEMENVVFVVNCKR